MKYLAAHLLLVLVLMGAYFGGVAARAQDTPTPGEDIPLQTVEVNGRRFTVDPFHLFDCELTRREISLPQSDEADGLVAVIDAQCFYRDEDGQMVPLDAFTSADQGDTMESQVGRHLVSAPQIRQEPLDGPIGVTP
jgi:hypothetical protein